MSRLGSLARTLILRAVLGLFIYVPAICATENNPGVWAALTLTDSFKSESNDSPWRYLIDAQIRYFDVGSGANQQLLSPALGYQAGKNLQLWFGYARLRTRTTSGAKNDENRFFQQLNWTAGQIYGGTLTMRARLLQRDQSSGDDLGLVIRFLAKYAKPISSNPNVILVLSIEPWLDLVDTDWGGEAGINQNRIFAGFNWRLSEKTSLETGYLNQYLALEGIEDLSNHLGVIALKTSF